MSVLSAYGYEPPGRVTLVTKPLTKPFTNLVYKVPRRPVVYRKDILATSTLQLVLLIPILDAFDKIYVDGKISGACMWIHGVLLPSPCSFQHSILITLDFIISFLKQFVHLSSHIQPSSELVLTSLELRSL